MNIFEELTENYTYNGSISMKAIEDDIVTLENHIDSLNATIREANLRGKNPAQLTTKLRDEKIRLSLLNSFYKKVKETQPEEDNQIADIFGVSGTAVKEVSTKVLTAANGRPPKPQNFEEAEIEKVEETVADYGTTVANEQDTDNEIVIEEVKSMPEESIKKLVAEHTNNDVIIVRHPDQLMKQDEEKTEAVASEPEVNAESVPPPTLDDYEKPVETEAKTEEYSYDSGDIMFGEPIEVPEERNDITPPTLEDYVEPEDVGNIQFWDEPEPIMENFYKPITNFDLDFGNTASVSEEVCPPVKEFRSYEAFENIEGAKIYVSFDLSYYTDMVNTDSIKGYFNDTDKTLELTFTDIRDYPLFVYFLNEKNEKRSLFKRSGKKPKSIFMYVRTETNDSEYEYGYEFVDCRVIDVFDSEYQSMRSSVYYGQDTHEFFVKLKYKKLRIG